MAKDYFRGIISGASGSGKTVLSLQMAHLLASDPSRIFVIDTEGGSLNYRNKRVGNVEFGNFNVYRMYHPYASHGFQEIIDQNQGNFDVLIVDSFTSEWHGRGGALQRVEDIVAQQKKNGRKPDRRAVWNDIKLAHESLLDTITNNRHHAIVTVQPKNDAQYDRQGNITSPPSLRQQEGTLFPFDLCLHLDHKRRQFVIKTRDEEVTGPAGGYTTASSQLVLLHLIGAAQSKKELRRVYDAFPNLQEKEWFKNALKERQHEVG